jgi:hypothetical protein
MQAILTKINYANAKASCEEAGRSTGFAFPEL